MAKSMKKPEFLAPFARLFTAPDGDAYDSIAFQSSEFFGDEPSLAIAAPVIWSATSVSVIADQAAHQAIPADLVAIEENTVPSWLWAHRGRGKRVATESDLRSIFDRLVGAAVAKGWKLGLFTSEKHARVLFDESRYALMQRHIAIAPHVMASLGLAWAYGIDETAQETSATRPETIVDLSNDTIDAILEKSKKAAPPHLWKTLFTTSPKDITNVTLRLSDIAAEWYSSAPNPAQAVIDLLALRHEDGSINIEQLKQTARNLSVILDLLGRSDITIGFANLSPLLLSLGLTYDSDAARAFAASIAALLTAECTAASAEMAALRGPSLAFSDNRDAVMRSLRNHRRAVYGDMNDYEKLSVLPASLSLKNCPDLALTAEAQRRWDEALIDARTFGLRAILTTDLTPIGSLAVLMESSTQGLEPLMRLTVLKENSSGQYTQTAHPAIAEGLVRLGYSAESIKTTHQHIVGTHSLRRTPAINHASLRARGLSDLAIEKIEAYLPCVDSLSLAITPWVIGVDFCRDHLKIPLRVLQSPRFNLLRHLGFSDSDVLASTVHCYGHGSVRTSKALNLRHRPLLACGAEISAESRIRMAAAVQSFVSCDVGLTAVLPAQQSAEKGSEVTLSAWRRGLKSLTISFDPSLAAKPATAMRSSSRRITPTVEAHPTSFKQMPRRSSASKTTPVVLGSKKTSLSGRSTSKH